MNTRYQFNSTDEDRIVYVRPVDVSELPEDIQEHADGATSVYAVHNSDGERLALVKDRELAFLLAREQNLSAVNVH